MSALDSELMKLEMFPPGHEATSIMPMAIVQVMLLPKASVSRKVSSGRKTSWLSMPAKMGLGLLKRSTKVRGLIPKATPYMMKARTILTVFIPPAFKATEMLSILLAISGVIALRFKFRQKYE